MIFGQGVLEHLEQNCSPEQLQQLFDQIGAVADGKVECIPLSDLAMSDPATASYIEEQIEQAIANPNTVH